MSPLAPTLEAFFTQRLADQLDASSVPDTANPVGLPMGVERHPGW